MTSYVWPAAASHVFLHRRKPEGREDVQVCDLLRISRTVRSRQFALCRGMRPRLRRAYRKRACRVADRSLAQILSSLRGFDEPRKHAGRPDHRRLGGGLRADSAVSRRLHAMHCPVRTGPPPNPEIFKAGASACDNEHTHTLTQQWCKDSSKQSPPARCQEHAEDVVFPPDHDV